MRSRWWLLGVVGVLALGFLLYRCGRSDRAAPSTPVASASAAHPSSPRRVRFGATSRQPVALMGAERVETPGIIGSLEGVVLSRGEERPISGATLVFGAGELFTVKSGEDGSFRFTPPREGAYELSLASAPGHLPFAPEWGHSPLLFVARMGEGLRGARVYLTPAVDYAVTVLDTQGKPVEGAEVSVLGERAAGAALTEDTAPRRTNAEGEASISAPDDAIVEARHALGRGRARIDFAAQVSHRVVITLGQKLPARAELAGQVVDPDGTPVPDALVVARYDADNPASPEARLIPDARELSDEHGKFALDVDVGRYVVTANASGLAAAVVRDVHAPRSDLVLRLVRGAGLFGRVTDGDRGAPIPSFVIIVARPQGALAREIVTVEPTLDPDGRYSIPALPPGSYEVTASAQGYALAAEKKVELRDEDVEASFALGRGGTIRGRVTDAETEAPLHRARVSLEGRFMGLGEVPLLASATTNEDGRFEIVGVGSGPQSIFTAARDHHARLLTGLEVRAGSAVDVQVALTPVKEGETPSIELAGIGAVLSAKDDVLVIGQVVDGGGAAEAGLVPGDAIVAIEGVPVTDLGFAGSVQRIRGPEGSRVMLRVQKKGAEPTDIAVARRRIRAP